MKQLFKRLFNFKRSSKVKVNVTNEMIVGTNVMDTRGCIGFKALNPIVSKFVPNEPIKDISWGSVSGFIVTPRGSLVITAFDHLGNMVDMMAITEPRPVTLKKTMFIPNTVGEYINYENN